MKLLKKVILVLVVALAVVLTAACVKKPQVEEPVEVTLSEISVDASSAKTTFYLGEEFSSAGVKVTAKYSDDTTKDVSSEATFSPRQFDCNKVGTYQVVVKYTEGKASRTAYYSVSVADPMGEVNELVGINVYKGEEELTFLTLALKDITEGFKLDLAALGIVTKGVYADGSEKVVNATITQPESYGSRGVHEVVAHYEESIALPNGETYHPVEETFFLVLVEDAVTSIAFKSGTVEFAWDANIDTADWVVEATLESGAVVELSASDFEVEGEVEEGSKANFTITYAQEQVAEVDDVVVQCEVEVTRLAKPATGESSYALSANDFTAGDITANEVVVPGVIELLASSGKKFTVDANGKKIGDYEYTQRIKLNGGSSATERLIKLTVAGPATITIHAMSGSSSAERPVILYTIVEGALKEVEGCNVSLNGASLQETVFKTTKAGTYYIGSTAAINIYGVYLTVREPSKYEFSANDLTAGDITENQEIIPGKVDLLASSGKKFTVDANGKKIGDYEYTQRIKLNGASSATERLIAIDLSNKSSLADATITIHAMSGSSSAERPVILYTIVEGALKEVEGCNVSLNGASLQETVFTVKEAGTYYIGSTAAINVYGVYVSVIEDIVIETVFSANDLTAGDITENQVIVPGKVELLASSGKKFTVDANGKKIGDVEYTQRIKFNGASTATERLIKITVESDATITIHAMSGSSSAERPVILYTIVEGALKEVAGCNVSLNGAGLQEVSFKVAAGTYYIGSTAAINLYGFKVVEVK